MKRTMSSFVAAAALATTVGLAPTGAHAGVCDSKVYIFQETQRVPISYYPGVVCLADPSTDARVLLPTTDSLYVRYAADLGPDVPELTGVLNGLGFVNTPFTLKRTNILSDAQPVWDYDSADFDTPAGLPAVGCITATIFLPDDETDSNTMSSPGATC